MPGFLDEIRNGTLGVDEEAEADERYRREILPLMRTDPRRSRALIKADPALDEAEGRYFVQLHAEQDRQRDITAGVERRSSAALAGLVAPFVAGPVAGPIARLAGRTAQAVARVAGPAAEAVKDIGTVARVAGPVAASQAAGPLIQKAGPFLVEVAMGEAAPPAGGLADAAATVAARAGARKKVVGSFLEEITNRQKPARHVDLLWEKESALLDRLSATDDPRARTAIEDQIAALRKEQSDVRFQSERVDEAIRPAGEKATEIIEPGDPSGYKARPNERGSYYLPSPREFVEARQFAPKLKRYPSRDPALRLDEKYALIKNRANAGAMSAEERARSLQRGLDPQGKWAVDRYLVLKDELARVRSGLQVTGGRTEAQLLTDIQNTVAQVPAGLDLGQREATFRVWSDEVFDRLVQAEVLDPRSKRTDYVPHLVRRYYDEYADRIQGGGRGVGQLKPGQTKRAEGSELDIERDPFRAMAFADYLSRRAEADSLFRREVTNLYDKTARIRNGVERFDRSQHALYSFGGPGQAHLIKGVDADDIVSAVVAQGPPRPGTVSYEITHNGRKYNILPRDLAEGLFDVGKNEELDPVRRVFAGAASLGRTTQLALNPQFQLAQIPADLATAYMNVPPWKWPQLSRALSERLGENIEDQVTALAGRYSERLAKKREAGIVTEIWENLAAKGEPDHVVKDVTPIAAKERFMGIPGLRRAAEAPKFAYDAIIGSGQVRESTIKGALADVYMSMGASPDRAAFWANRVMGKYFMTSGAGRQFHRHIQMTKWFLEQMLRMTVDAATDPATGKWSVRGLVSGPLPYIVAYKVLQEKLNNRSEATREAAKQLPDYASTGIVGKVHEDGSIDVWKPDTLANLAQGMIETAVTGAETAKEFGPVAALKRTASDLGSSMGQRANPLLKAAYTAATGERLGGGGVLPREAQGTATEAQIAYNEKRGGIPGLTPYGQEMVEIFGGAIPRLARLLRSKDTEGRHEGKRMLGVPLYKVFPKQALAEEKAKTAHLWEQKLIDSRAAGDVAEYGRAIQKLRQFGYDDARLKRILTLSQRREAELENLTREERRARALRKLKP